MRIAVIGGGPGGLYFAYLWKRRHPDAEIDLFEQNPEGATWGFGVVFSEQALEFLRADDPETVDAITPRMESWKNITLNLGGESVEIRSASRSYGAVRALDNVSLTVAPREFVSLLGPSGSGKTTLLETIAGVRATARGTVSLMSRDVTHWSPELRGLGLVYQRGALFPHRSVHENIGWASGNVAAINGIAREAQDAWALRSHQRAAAGWDDGRLRAEVGPVYVDGHAVTSDGHRVSALEFVELGIAQARRAWLTKEQVLNTRTWPQLRELRKK